MIILPTAMPARRRAREKIAASVHEATINAMPTAAMTQCGEKNRREAEPDCAADDGRDERRPHVLLRVQVTRRGNRNRPGDHQAGACPRQGACGRSPVRAEQARHDDVGRGGEWRQHCAGEKRGYTGEALHCEAACPRRRPAAAPSSGTTPATVPGTPRKAPASAGMRPTSSQATARRRRRRSPG